MERCINDSLVDLNFEFSFKGDALLGLYVEIRLSMELIGSEGFLDFAKELLSIIVRVVCFASKDILFVGFEITSFNRDRVVMLRLACLVGSAWAFSIELSEFNIVSNSTIQQQVVLHVR